MPTTPTRKHPRAPPHKSPLHPILILILILITNYIGLVNAALISQRYGKRIVEGGEGMPLFFGWECGIGGWVKGADDGGGGVGVGGDEDGGGV